MSARRIARGGVAVAALLFSGCAYTWGIERAPLIGGPGPHSRWIRVGSIGEPYDVDLHVPARLAPSPGRVPFVIVLHGSGGTGPGMERRTRFSELADSAGFAVAYPNARKNAQGRTLWSTGESFASDTAMLRALIDSVAVRVPVDRNRVYLSGFSNGGGMAYRAARAMPSVFAAIGVVAATSRGEYAARQTESHVASRPMPLIAIHGMRDDNVPFDGAPPAVRAWATSNGCDDRVAADTLNTQTIRTTYTSCSSRAGAVLYAMVNGKHFWPNADMREAPLAATAVIWRFFHDHAEAAR